MFAWGASQVQIDWSNLNVLPLIFTLGSCVAFFHGLLIFQATLAIWKLESVEVMNTVTYGGVQAAQYPIDIYSTWLRRAITYIIPLACISDFPVLLIMNKTDPLGTSAPFQAVSSVPGFVFLGASQITFRYGIRQYASTCS